MRAFAAIQFSPLRGSQRNLFRARRNAVPNFSDEPKAFRHAEVEDSVDLYFHGYIFNCFLDLSNTWVRRHNGSTFSRKPRERTVANMDCRCGGLACCNFVRPPTGLRGKRHDLKLNRRVNFGEQFFHLREH